MVVRLFLRHREIEIQNALSVLGEKYFVCEDICASRKQWPGWVLLDASLCLFYFSTLVERQGKKNLNLGGDSEQGGKRWVKD